MFSQLVEQPASRDGGLYRHYQALDGMDGPMTKRVRKVFDLLLAAGAVVAVVTVSMSKAVTPLTFPSPPRLEPGRSMVLASHSWAQGRRHVVFAVDPQCAACEASVPFYRQVLAETASKDDIDVLMVSDKSTGEVRSWLTDRNVDGAALIRVRSLARLGVVGLPTALILDAGGTITDIVIGVPTEEEERQFVLRLADSSAPALNSSDLQVPEVTEDALPSIAARGRPQIVDVAARPRQRRVTRPGTLHIPLDELDVRGLAELSRARPVVLGAGAEGLADCRAAAVILRGLGFTDVAILVGSPPAATTAATVGRSR